MLLSVPGRVQAAFDYVEGKITAQLA